MQRFSQSARKVLALAQEEAERFQHALIGTEHLLLAIEKSSDSAAHSTLQSVGLTPERIEQAFAELFPALDEPSGDLDLAREAKRALEIAVEEARQQPSNTIEPHHLLMALARMQEGGAYQLFIHLDVFPDEIYEHITTMLTPLQPEPSMEEITTLRLLAQNLTDREASWQLPAIAGRVYHMDRIQQILGRRYHKKVLLVGQHGTGKSTIVDAITDHFVREGRNETVWRASYEDLVGGAQTYAEVEERLKNIIRELEASQHILHIPGMTRSILSGIDAMGIMRMLMYANIRLIQECPFDVYEEHLEDDSAIQRHFSILMVGALPAEDTRTVLIARKAEFEAHHEVQFLDSAIEAILEYADEVMPSRYNPDQALQFMDEIGAIVASRDDLKSPINEDIVVEIVRYLTGDNDY